MKLVLIIPAYNEEESIVSVITALERDYSQFDYVIIDDGSSDRTAQICREHDFHLVSQPINLGLAGAFQTGMKYAQMCIRDRYSSVSLALECLPLFLSMFMVNLIMNASKDRKSVV